MKQPPISPPPTLSSVYTNTQDGKTYDVYHVRAIEEDKIFELVSEDKNYHVRYTYRNLGENLTEMTYYEWVENGDLSAPFVPSMLEKLKSVLESKGK